MIHLGDITQINGAEIEPVDCITFGSPCQDLSVAGKRAGLAGERSGLFMEAVRIIKEMRKKTNGVYPTFAVWENVAGAFSSNKGEDFRAVLEELAHIVQAEAVIPRPEKRWEHAGCILLDGGSIAYRLMDSQYWGVPQRRKRIALCLDLHGHHAPDIVFEWGGIPSESCGESSLVDLGGKRAGEILFERESLSGHPEPSIQAWQNSAAYPKDRAGAGCIPAYCPEIGHALKAKANLQFREGSETYIAEAFCQAYAIDGYNAQVTGDVAATMGVNCGITTGRNGVIEAYAIDCRNATINPDVNGTLQSKEGGGYNLNTNNVVMVEDPIVLESNQNNATITQNGICPTLPASMGLGGGYTPMVVLNDQGGGYNMNSNNVVMVPCAAVASCHTNSEITTGGVSPTLLSRMHKGVPYICGYEQQTAIAAVRWIVRRLTPLECERLQGFPDNWTLIGEWTDSKGKKHKEADTPRYKALGNSIALPQWWWLTQKMKPYLPDHAKLGSLFDGIGGFPLVWETGYGKGTARWASEIEEFPIAVTKYHFPEEETKC